MPSNKAFVYNMMIELSRGGIITPQEIRKWLLKNFGLPIEPELPTQQPIQGMRRNTGTTGADVMGWGGKNKRECSG